MKLSVVTTLYNSAGFINEFYERVKKCAEMITDDYEMIFVNDGSPDESLKILLSLYEADKKIKIVDLSRNFGHHKAIISGLSYAKGEYIFLIDSDLEEAPELLERFFREIIDSQDVDMVYGVQAQRDGGIIKRIGGGIFYALINILSDQKIPNNLMTARIMTRRYVDNLLKYKDKDPFVAGLLSLTGFHQKPIEAKKGYKGYTSYSFLKRVNVFINAVLSFSSRPLVYLLYLGLTIVILSVVYIIWLLANKLLLNSMLEGWVLIVISVWLLGGMIMCALGVIGLYLSKIFDEVKERPLTIVKRIYRKED